VTTLEHPPFYPDQTAADFCPFHLLKLLLKGRRFCNVIEIIKNVTEGLKMLSQKFSRNVSNTFTVAGRSVYLHEGIILEKI
jgi:hypothetical protein